MSGIDYPKARRGSQIDTYRSLTKGNVQIDDPYRWLEESSSSETTKFVDEQSQTFASYIGRYPHREEMRQVISGVTSTPQLGCPHRSGGYYYYSYRENTPQPVVFRKTDQDGTSDEAIAFLDANKLSADGASAVQLYTFSRNAGFFAYGVSDAGSDWLTLYVKALKSCDFETRPEPGFYDGVRLADKVESVKWSGIHWSQNDDGFFYQRFPRPTNPDEPDRDSALYFHRVGTSQDEDVLVYQEKEEPFQQYFPEVSDDGEWLVITKTIHGATSNDIVLMSIADGSKKHTRLGSDGISNPKFIGNIGASFYFSCTWNASRGRVVVYDMAEDRWSEHVAEDSTALLRAAYAYDERYLLLVYTKDVKDELWVFDLRTGEKLRQVGKDIIGSVQIKETLGGRINQQLFLKFSSYLAPDCIYRITGESIVLHSQSLALDPPGTYVTRQEFFTSKDGTRVPMFLTHHRDYVKGGPVLLYGYGGFNISVVPKYNPAFMSFLRGFGGLVACANLRGGGEYGEEWHKAGMLEKKQNVLDDFHGAAQYLVRDGYTTPDKLIAMGGSNGGLVVAACMNQHPELYGCVLAKVPVLDCLRYTTSPAGSLGISEIGDPADPTAFDYLYGYSPLHNVNAAKPYPPILLFTADHDDRVPPMHSLKYAATLQYVKHDNIAPMMVRVDKQSGHGQGKSLVKMIDELCDQWAFVSISTSLKWRVKLGL